MAIDPLEVTTAITDSYRRYLKTSFRLRDPALAKLFHEELGKFQFAKGPILEATPPFKAGCSLSVLAAEGLLDPLLKDLIHESHPYLKTKPLYLHQEQAIRKALQGRNVVISSGTSSGKTECFLIPILNHLIREHSRGTLGPGVRALLLYPMNALANDQLRRLRDLGEVFAKHIPGLPITFGRYVGDTAETQKEALEKFKKEHDGKDPAPGELLSREEMRTSPPHILLTNYAMLEYLLLRPDDCSFFDGTHAQHWKFLVLDEAHSYNGATGIEMGMLIRRLKERVCGSVPGVLKCIATSATLGSGEADSPKVAEFASNLFGESFEWESPDQNRQDVVRGERQSPVEPQISFTPPASLYVELENIRQSTKDESGLRDQFLKICTDRGIPEAILNKAAEQGGNAARLLYEILSHDLRLSRLKQLIEKPRKFDECCEELFGSNVEALKCLVDLTTWAKPDSESLPLLPARYHLFVRAPEGAFLSLYPPRKISLERRERTAEGNPVFELASCRRCGQEYLVGRLSEGKLAHSQSDPEVRTKTIRYYLLRSFAAACEEDEDETVALPEDDVDGRAVKLCFKCGTTCTGDQAPSCGCGGDYVQELVEVRPKDGVLNKCLLCGLRSIDIVREFVFQQDAPAAVLATALYQKLGKDDPKARKILCFSDSRQDAAFFAPYLGGTYERILYRRLMMEAVGQNSGVADYRLESLVADVFALANDFDLLDPSLDEKQKRKLVWKCVLQEFCALDRRNCLEGVGLLAFVPIMPKAWEPPEDLLHGKLNLSRAEATAFYHILLNTLRLNMAVTFPEAGPTPNDEAFAPRNREYKIRGEGSIPESAIYSWVSPTGRLNTRLQFLMKLYQARNGRQENDSEARKLLGTIWEDLTARWKGQGIEAFHDRRHGTLFQLDYRFWRVLRGESAAAGWYVCDRCGGFSPVSVRAVCSTFGCDGKLTAIEHINAQTTTETNHYRHLYKTLSIAKMAVHEHTAQLKQDYATEVQLKFINGDINVLSCSTTFELGVDLGELETIFMRNVPPESSNYIQRAGRAGRRTSSAGFTFTFARLRPHDLNYFARPEEIVGGYVKPPAVEIVNEKIVRRHLHAVALSEFWKRYREHFGAVNKFFGLGAGNPSSTDGFECFRSFLQGKSQSLMEALKRITPLEMQPVFDLDGWRWVEDLFDLNEGPLELARKAICGDYEQIDDFWRDKKDELQTLLSNPGLHSSQRGKLNRDIDWAEKTLQTISGRKLIDFLATHGVLPKYGFPVDVVELTALHHAPAAKRIQLERDLRIAISEFAPGSQVVANGYLWQSVGLKVVKTKTWDIFWYAVCPASGCDRFQIRPGTIEQVPPDLTCEACGNNIPRGYIHRMLRPIFGFTTSREVEPLRPGEARPRRDFSTRPYFVTHESRQRCEHSIGQLLVSCEYSPRGELAVVCKGKKGQGFKVCFDCGYAVSTLDRTKTSHRTPLGRECSAPFRSPWHLGHTFQTDLLLLAVTTIDHAAMPPLRKDESFWLSFLYSLLEGASEALGIRRRDLDGCLYPKPDQYGLVLFDTVPGGAGHVKRLMDEPNLRATLRASKARLEQTEAHNCGEETSCYGCLRNYDNQFCHDQLRRGPVLKFLRERL